MIKRTVKYILLTYIVSGLSYSIAGYVYRSAIGKENVFSPLIGIPLTIADWPEMVYADLKHFGTMPQDIAAFLSITLCIIVFIIREICLRKQSC